MVTVIIVRMTGMKTKNFSAPKNPDTIIGEINKMYVAYVCCVYECTFILY